MKTEISIDALYSDRGMQSENGVKFRINEWDPNTIEITFNYDMHHTAYVDLEQFKKAIRKLEA